MKKIDYLKSKIAEANARINELKKQVKKELQAEFTEALAELFDAYPFVKSLSFTAYTPYFNDGDECTYCVNHDYCKINGFDEDDDDEEGEDGLEDVLQMARETIYVREGARWVDKPNPNFKPLYKEAVEAFRSALAVVDDDNWKDMVGDHVRVTITRDGIETSDYEHD